MIASLFLPEFWGSRRLLGRRIAVYAVLDDAVVGMLVYAGRSSVRVLQSQSVALPSGAQVTREQQIVSALTSCAALKKTADQVYVMVPSAMVICKELVLPLTDRDKIALVLGYEIEQTLPFSLEHALIDFVISNKKMAEQQGTQLVAAVARRADLTKHIELYQQAGIQPTRAIVDVFALAGLWARIKPEKELIASALVFFDAAHTTVALVQYGIPRMVRTIPIGVRTLVQQIAAECALQPEEIALMLSRESVLHLGTDQCARVAHKQLMTFCQQLQFTLTSFATKLGLEKPIEQLVCTGLVDNINGLSAFVAEALMISSMTMDSKACANLSGVKAYSGADVHVQTTQPLLLAGAMPLPLMQEFDLARALVLPSVQRRLRIQFLVACGLVIGILAASLGSAYWQVYALATQLGQAQAVQIARLKTAQVLPPNAFATKKTFNALLTQAQKVVDQKKEQWLPFGGQRLRPLPILAELVKIIDKKQFDVTINSVELGSEQTGPRVQIDGFFRSKTGSSHFTHFEELETRFKESSLLRLAEPINPSLAEEKGVRFVARMGMKEAS